MDGKKSFGVIEFLIILIVILLVLVILIPSLFNLLTDTSKKEFIDYTTSEVNRIKDEYKSSVKYSDIYVYSINNKDAFKGYVVIDARNKDDIKYTLFIHNNKYQLVNTDISNNINDKDIKLYEKNDWLNLTSEGTACRVIEPDVSVNCLNKDGYIIAQ